MGSSVSILIAELEQMTEHNTTGVLKQTRERMSGGLKHIPSAFSTDNKCQLVKYKFETETKQHESHYILQRSETLV